MKKIILTIALAIGAALTAPAQDQFFGLDPDKFMKLIEQTQKMPRDNAMLIVEQTMQVMSTNPKSYRKVLEIVTDRLSNPADSLHNEDVYMAVLKHATQSFVLSNNEKMRPKALLESAMKNRVGVKASDIDYITDKGEKANLLNNDNRFTLLYFNDPDCDACAKVKENLQASTAIKQAVETGIVRVVAINPMANEKLWKKTQMPAWVTNGWNKSQSISDGGSYDLPTLPVFYVLGRDNTVLAKNEASLKRIEKLVAKIMAMPDADSATLANLLFSK